MIYFIVIVLQWKLVSSSSKSNKDVASNMFAEPQTPWNVRHPRSSFTTTWEGVQAFLLIYVAFTVTCEYRLSVHVSPDIKIGCERL